MLLVTTLALFSIKCLVLFMWWNAKLKFRAHQRCQLVDWPFAAGLKSSRLESLVSAVKTNVTVLNVLLYKEVIRFKMVLFSHNTQVSLGTRFYRVKLNLMLISAFVVLFILVNTCRFWCLFYFSSEFVSWRSLLNNTTNNYSRFDDLFSIGFYTFVLRTNFRF